MMSWLLFLNFVILCFFENMEMQNTILSLELPKYKNKEFMFGRPIASKACEVNDEKFDPSNYLMLITMFY